MTALGKFGLLLARRRWRFTVVAPVFMVLAASQFANHDPMFWLGVFEVILFSALAAGGWVLKRRADRDGTGAKMGAKR